MEDGIPGWLQHCHKCYRYSDTNNFYFILFYFLLFFLILLFFFFTLFSWKDDEEGT